MHFTASRPRRIARLAATAGLAAAALAPTAHAAPTPSEWVGSASATLDAGGTQSPTNCYRCVIVEHGADGKPLVATGPSVVTSIELADFTGKVAAVAMRRDGATYTVARSGDLVTAPVGRGTLTTRVPLRTGDILGIAVFGGNVGLVDTDAGTGFDRLGEPTGLGSFNFYAFGSGIPANGGLGGVDVKARFAVAPDPDGDGFVDNVPQVHSIYAPVGEPLVAMAPRRIRQTTQVARHITVPLTCSSRNVVHCEGMASIYIARPVRGGGYVKDKFLGGGFVGPKAGATQTIELFEATSTKAAFDQVFAVKAPGSQAPRVILDFASSRPGKTKGRQLTTLR